LRETGIIDIFNFMNIRRDSIASSKCANLIGRSTAEIEQRERERE
jgi:hypothetical protein